MKGDGRAYSAIMVDGDGAVDFLTLNRPERLNALDDTMVDELLDYFAGLAERPSTRIVVMRGAGRAFCAGLDLKADEGFAVDPAMGGPANGLRRQRRISEIVMRMRRAPQPIVAVVHGAAAGGGFALALAADIRIAGRSARMNAAFIRLGFSGCDIGLSYFLPRLAGTSVAAELMLTGRFIDAERALSVGLVSEVVDDDRLDEAFRPYVEAMLAASPLGLRLTKECMVMSVDAPSLEAAIAMEDRNQILCTQTDDLREAVAAFKEKRSPVYHDR